MRTLATSALSVALVTTVGFVALPVTAAQAAAPRPEVSAVFSPAEVAVGSPTTFETVVTGPSSWAPGTKVDLDYNLAATKNGCKDTTVTLDSNRQAVDRCTVTPTTANSLTFTVDASGPKKAHRTAEAKLSVTPASETPSTPPEPAPTPTMPDATNTGVPEGTTLQPSGALKITKDGTVVDGLHITGGVTVNADNVTIRNSIVDSSGTYPIRLDSANKGLVVEDTEIDGNGKASVAILKGNYTLNRVDIHDVKDGPRIEGDNVLVENSWIHDLTRVEGGHHDTLQIRKGTNIVIRNNTLDAYNATLDDPMNAALQIGSPLGTVPVSGLVVENNYMNGGNYTVNGGSSWVKDAVYRNNRIGRDFRYGVKTNLGAGSVWETSNVWADNGQPAA